MTASWRQVRLTHTLVPSLAGWAHSCKVPRALALARRIPFLIPVHFIYTPPQCSCGANDLVMLLDQDAIFPLVWAQGSTDATKSLRHAHWATCQGGPLKIKSAKFINRRWLI